MTILEFALSIVSSLLAAYLGYFFRKYREGIPQRNLKKILNFGEDEIIFVFAYREEVPISILPRTSTEDMASINNVVGSLVKTGWQGPIKVRDTSHLTPAEKQKNIVTFCSPKSNHFTAELLRELRGKGIKIYDFRPQPENQSRWEIFLDIARYPSPSYDEIAQQTRNIPEGTYTDVALLAKVTNPWNAANKILIISGIRGFGTWGAAEFLRKRSQELYQQLRKNKEFKTDGNFAAVLKITYNNLDITEHEILDIIPIPG